MSCSPALVLNERGKERGERKWFSLAIRLSPWIARGWLLEDSTGSWPLLRKVESRNNKGISLSLSKNRKERSGTEGENEKGKGSNPISGLVRICPSCFSFFALCLIHFRGFFASYLFTRNRGKSSDRSANLSPRNYLPSLSPSFFIPSNRSPYREI